MTLRIPESLQWLAYLTGSEWPKGDESAMFQIGEYWHEAAGRLKALIPELDQANRKTDAVLTGEAGAAAQATFALLLEGDYSVEKLVEAVAALGDLASNAGTQIEYTKLQIITSLAIAGAEISYALACAPATFGASLSWVPPIEAITIAAVRQLVAQLLKRLTGELVKALTLTGVKSLLKHAVKEAVHEALEEAAQELAIEEIQKSKGHRDGIDWKQVGMNAVGGAAGGAAGHATQGPLKHALGDSSSVLGKITKGALTGYGTGVVGNVFGSIASDGGLTAGGLDPLSVFGGASTQAISGALHGTGHPHPNSPAGGLGGLPPHGDLQLDEPAPGEKADPKISDDHTESGPSEKSDESNKNDISSPPNAPHDPLAAAPPYSSEALPPYTATSASPTTNATDTHGSPGGSTNTARGAGSGDAGEGHASSTSGGSNTSGSASNRGAVSPTGVPNTRLGQSFTSGSKTAATGATSGGSSGRTAPVTTAAATSMPNTPVPSTAGLSAEAATSLGGTPVAAPAATSASTGSGGLNPGSGRGAEGPLSTSQSGTTGSHGLSVPAEQSAREGDNDFGGRRAQAPPTPMIGERFEAAADGLQDDGLLAGWGTQVSYDQRRFQLPNGSWVRDFEVRLSLEPGSGVRDDKVATLRQRLTDAVQEHLNDRYHLPDGDALNITVLFDSAAPHATVTVHTGAHTDQANFSTRAGDGELVHEVLHFLGLPEGYDDRRAPMQPLLRRRIDSDGPMGARALQEGATLSVEQLAKIDEIAQHGPIHDLPHDATPPPVRPRDVPHRDSMRTHVPTPAPTSPHGESSDSRWDDAPEWLRQGAVAAQWAESGGSDPARDDDVAPAETMVAANAPADHDVHDGPLYVPFDQHAKTVDPAHADRIAAFADYVVTEAGRRNEAGQPGVALRVHGGGNGGGRSEGADAVGEQRARSVLDAVRPRIEALLQQKGLPVDLVTFPGPTSRGKTLTDDIPGTDKHARRRMVVAHIEDQPPVTASTAPHRTETPPVVESEPIDQILSDEEAADFRAWERWASDGASDTGDTRNPGENYADHVVPQGDSVHSDLDAPHRSAGDLRWIQSQWEAVREDPEFRQRLEMVYRWLSPSGNALAANDYQLDAHRDQPGAQAALRVLYMWHRSGENAAREFAARQHVVRFRGGAEPVPEQDWDALRESNADAGIGEQSDTDDRIRDVFSDELRTENARLQSWLEQLAETQWPNVSRDEPRALGEVLNERHWWRLYLHSDDHAVAMETHPNDPGAAYESELGGFTRRDMQAAFEQFLDDPRALQQPIDWSSYNQMRQLATGIENPALGGAEDENYQTLGTSQLAHDMAGERVGDRQLAHRSSHGGGIGTPGIVGITEQDGELGLTPVYSMGQVSELVNAVFDRYRTDITATTEHERLRAIARAVRTLQVMLPFPENKDWLNTHLLLSRLLLANGFRPVVLPSTGFLFSGGFSLDHIATALRWAQDRDVTTGLDDSFSVVPLRGPRGLLLHHEPTAPSRSNTPPTFDLERRFTGHPDDLAVGAAVHQWLASMTIDEPSRAPRTGPTTLSAVLPRRHWWRLYLDERDHNDALQHDRSNPGGMYDSDEHFGFQADMESAYQSVLDDPDVVGRAIGWDEYHRMYALVTSQTRVVAGSRGNFNIGGAHPGRIFSTHFVILDTLADDLTETLDGRPLVTHLDARSEGTTTPPSEVWDRTDLIAVSYRDSEGELVLTLLFPPKGLPAMINEAFARYYQELGQAQSEDDQLRAIARVMRTFGVLHPFQDGNGRLHNRFLLPRLLLANGFQPVVMPSSLYLFNGGFSLAQLVTALRWGQNRNLAIGLGDLREAEPGHQGSADSEPAPITPNNAPVQPRTATDTGRAPRGPIGGRGLPVTGPTATTSTAPLHASPVTAPESAGRAQAALRALGGTARPRETHDADLRWIDSQWEAVREDPDFRQRLQVVHRWLSPGGGELTEEGYRLDAHRGEPAAQAALRVLYMWHRSGEGAARDFAARQRVVRFRGGAQQEQRESFFSDTDSEGRDDGPDFDDYHTESVVPVTHSSAETPPASTDEIAQKDEVKAKQVEAGVDSPKSVAAIDDKAPIAVDNDLISIPGDGWCLLYAVVLSTPPQHWPAEWLSESSTPANAYSTALIQAFERTVLPDGAGPLECARSALFAQVRQFVLDRGGHGLPDRAVALFRGNLRERASLAQWVEHANEQQLRGRLTELGFDENHLVDSEEWLSPNELRQRYIEEWTAEQTAKFRRAEARRRAREEVGIQPDGGVNADPRVGRQGQFEYLRNRGAVPAIGGLHGVEELRAAVFAASTRRLTDMEYAHLLEAVDSWRDRGWTSSYGDMFSTLVAHTLDVQVHDVIKGSTVGPENATRTVNVRYNGHNHYDGNLPPSERSGGHGRVDGPLEAHIRRAVDAVLPGRDVEEVTRPEASGSGVGATRSRRNPLVALGKATTAYKDVSQRDDAAFIHLLREQLTDPETGKPVLTSLMEDLDDLKVLVTAPPRHSLSESEQTAYRVLRNSAGPIIDKAMGSVQALLRDESALNRFRHIGPTVLPMALSYIGPALQHPPSFNFISLIAGTHLKAVLQMGGMAGHSSYSSRLLRETVFDLVLPFTVPGTINFLPHGKLTDREWAALAGSLQGAIYFTAGFADYIPALANKALSLAIGAGLPFPKTEHHALAKGELRLISESDTRPAADTDELGSQPDYATQEALARAISKIRAHFAMIETAQQIFEERGAHVSESTHRQISLIRKDVLNLERLGAQLVDAPDEQGLGNVDFWPKLGYSAITVGVRGGGLAASLFAHNPSSEAIVVPGSSYLITRSITELFDPSVTAHDAATSFIHFTPPALVAAVPALVNFATDGRQFESLQSAAPWIAYSLIANGFYSDWVGEQLSQWMSAGIATGQRSYPAFRDTVKSWLPRWDTSAGPPDTSDGHPPPSDDDESPQAMGAPGVPGGFTPGASDPHHSQATSAGPVSAAEGPRGTSDEVSSPSHVEDSPRAMGAARVPGGFVADTDDPPAAPTHQSTSKDSVSQSDSTVLPIDQSSGNVPALDVNSPPSTVPTAPGWRQFDESEDVGDGTTAGRVPSTVPSVPPLPQPARPSLVGPEPRSIVSHQTGASSKAISSVSDTDDETEGDTESRFPSTVPISPERRQFPELPPMAAGQSDGIVESTPSVRDTDHDVADFTDDEASRYTEDDASYYTDVDVADFTGGTDHEPDMTVEDRFPPMTPYTPVQLPPPSTALHPMAGSSLDASATKHVRFVDPSTSSDSEVGSPKLVSGQHMSSGIDASAPQTGHPHQDPPAASLRRQPMPPVSRRRGGGNESGVSFLNMSESRHDDIIGRDVPGFEPDPAVDSHTRTLAHDALRRRALYMNPVLGGRPALADVYAIRHPLGDAPQGVVRARLNARWWQGLSVEERRAMVAAFPEHVGNAEGLPPRVRDEANRIVLQDNLAREEADNLRLIKPIERLDAVNTALRRAANRLGRIGSEPPSVLALDPTAFRHDGRILVAVGGDPYRASSVSWMVPGMTTTMASLNDLLNDAVNLVESARAEGAPDPVVIVWVGYDAPSGWRSGRVTMRTAANDGGEILHADIKAFNAGRDANDTAGGHFSNNHVFGHSYGSTTTGFAGRGGRLAGQIRTVTLLGSPGAGPLARARDFNIGDNVFVAGSSRDPVTALGRTPDPSATIGQGIDPTLDSFGARRLASEFPRSMDSVSTAATHVSYYRPIDAMGSRSQSLANFGRIAAGQTDRLELHGNRVTGQPLLWIRRTFEPAQGPPAGRRLFGVKWGAPATHATPPSGTSHVAPSNETSELRFREKAKKLNDEEIRVVRARAAEIAGDAERRYRSNQNATRLVVHVEVGANGQRWPFERWPFNGRPTAVGQRRATEARKALEAEVHDILGQRGVPESMVTFRDESRGRGLPDSNGRPHDRESDEVARRVVVIRIEEEAPVSDRPLRLDFAERGKRLGGVQKDELKPFVAHVVEEAARRSAANEGAVVVNIDGGGNGGNPFKKADAVGLTRARDTRRFLKKEVISRLAERRIDPDMVRFSKPTSRGRSLPDGAPASGNRPADAAARRIVEIRLEDQPATGDVDLHAPVADHDPPADPSSSAIGRDQRTPTSEIGPSRPTRDAEPQPHPSDMERQPQIAQASAARRSAGASRTGPNLPLASTTSAYTSRWFGSTASVDDAVTDHGMRPSSSGRSSLGRNTTDGSQFLAVSTPRRGRGRPLDAESDSEVD
ncbi:WXG100-like domain-containing protein [Mycobacterium sp. Dal123C01]|uniref:WXG100-like domain-containing protein n=1 Tax=Mycobacterium sp. Dal123C01 TaxID=3457577 RepID=UPI00403E885D